MCLVSCVVSHGVATISRLLKIIGLFCIILSLLQGSFAKETYILKEPTSRSVCGGIARRIKVTEFLVKFKDDPDVNNKLKEKLINH